MKSIPTKDLIVGHKYLDDKGNTYVYIGLVSRTEVRYKIDEDFQPLTVLYGYVYLDTETMKLLFESSNYSKKELNYKLRHVFMKKSKRKLVSDIGIDSRIREIISYQDIVPHSIVLVNNPVTGTEYRFVLHDGHPDYRR